MPRNVVFFPPGFSALLHAPNVPTDAAQNNTAHPANLKDPSGDTEPESESNLPTLRKIPVGAHDPHPSETGSIVVVGDQFHAYAPGAEWLGAFNTREAAQRCLDMFFGRPVTAVRGSGLQLRPHVVGGRVADVEACVNWLVDLAAEALR